jgi:hypothetical protein
MASDSAKLFSVVSFASSAMPSLPIDQSPLSLSLRKRFRLVSRHSTLSGSLHLPISRQVRLVSDANAASSQAGFFSVTSEQVKLRLCSFVNGIAGSGLSDPEGLLLAGLNLLLLLLPVAARGLVAVCWWFWHPAPITAAAGGAAIAAAPLNEPELLASVSG